MQTSVQMLFYVGQTIITIFVFIFLYKKYSSIKSEEQVHVDLINNSENIIFTKDLNGVYTFVNRQFSVAQKEPIEYIIGKTDDDLYPPEYAKIYKENDDLVLKEQKAFQFKEIAPKKTEISFVTNKFPLIGKNGEILGIGGIVTDISDKLDLQKQLYEKELNQKLIIENQLKNSLQKTEVRLQGIIDAIPDNIVIIDRSGMWLDHYSSDLEGFPEYIKSSNPKGKNIKDIFSEGFYNYVMPFIKKSLDNESVIRAESISDNKKLFFEEIYVPLSKNESMVIIREITERKQNELILKRRTNELELLNEQLVELAYVVSHDIKAPLSVIHMMVENIYLGDEVELSTSTKEKLNQMKLRISRMTQLIDGILKYSEVVQTTASLPFELVDLSSLVDEVIYSLNPPENFEIKINSELPKIMYYKIRMHQIVQNLISNAIKFNDKERGLIEISCKEEDEYFEFCIQDNGPGIPKEDHQKIFQLFETGNPDKDEIRSDSSTGIGLNICDKIINSMGGKITVDSELGQGTCFSFTIPKSYSFN